MVGAMDAVLEGIGGVKHPEALKLERLYAAWIREFRMGRKAKKAPKAFLDQYSSMFNTGKPDIQFVSGLTAFTFLPSHLQIPFKKTPKVKVTSNGLIRFKDKQSWGPKIRMGTRLLTGAKLTPGEMTAILLHETGHNFYNLGAFMRLTCVMVYVCLIWQLVVILKQLVFSGKRNVSVNEDGDMKKTMFSLLKRNQDKLHRAMDGMDAFHRSIKNQKWDLGKPRRRPQTDVFDLALKMFLVIQPVFYLMLFGWRSMWPVFVWNMVPALHTYPQEEFADNFATSLGYGSELAGGLAKLGVSMQYIHPGTDVMSAIIRTIEIMLAGGTSTHPTMRRRFNLIRKYMKGKEGGSKADDAAIAENLKLIDRIESAYIKASGERASSVLEKGESVVDHLRSLLAKLFAKETDPVKLSVKND